MLGTASRPDHDLARGFGADEVLDGAVAGLAGTIEPVDLVLDTVGGERLERSPAIVRDGGRVVSIAEEPSERVSRAPIEARYFVVEPDSGQLVEIGRMLDRGELRVAIDLVFPLEDARAAFERSLATGKRGKVVLRVAGDDGGVAELPRRQNPEGLDDRPRRPGREGQAVPGAAPARPPAAPAQPVGPGSARLLAWLGFEALATTSSGFAATLGRLDGSVTRSEAIGHAADIAGATELPVSADLENGFADDPDGVAETLRSALQAGLAGCSVEDATGRPDAPIYLAGLAAERVRAAAEAAHRGPVRLVLTARAENYLHGRPDLADTIARLQAYQEAGADVLYAPGLRRLEDIGRLVAAVDRPVNVLALPGAPPVAEPGRRRGQPGVGRRRLRLRRPRGRGRGRHRAPPGRHLQLLGPRRPRRRGRPLRLRP